MPKLEFENPLLKSVRDLYNLYHGMQNSLNTIGGQIVKIAQVQTEDRTTLTALAYLFAHGITKFRIENIVQLEPNNINVYFNTDKGYIMVSIENNGEMFEVHSTYFGNKHDMLCDIRDKVILISEGLPEDLRKGFLEQNKYYLEVCK